MTPAGTLIVVHYAGDAVLADFSTVSEALACATSIQQKLASRNEDLPDERKVQFRIGVNLGELFVVARHSTFTYKGKPTKVQQVGRELGVHYVLEGSVQKAKGYTGRPEQAIVQIKRAMRLNPLYPEWYM